MFASAVMALANVSEEQNTMELAAVEVAAIDAGWASIIVTQRRRRSWIFLLTSYTC